MLGVATLGATPAGAQQDDSAEGTIVDFELQPAVLTVESGTTVTWTNTGDRPHTVTDRGGTFDAGEIAPGTQGQVTFEVPGTYEIFCQINPSTMNATVVVEPGENAPKAARIQAFDEHREGETRRFDPDLLEVEEGSELVLANVGGLQHSLAIDGGDSSGILEPGAEQGRFAGTNASLEAPEAGTYEFFCEVFPDEMRGVLEVTAAPPPETTTTAESPPDDAEEGEDGEDGEEAAPNPSPAAAADEPADGTALAYAIAALVIGTGAVGLAQAVRKR